MRVPFFYFKDLPTFGSERDLRAKTTSVGCRGVNTDFGHKKKALLFRELLSGKRDLNPRHPGPKPDALPAALLPVACSIIYTKQKF